MKGLFSVGNQVVFRTGGIDYESIVLSYDASNGYLCLVEDEDADLDLVWKDASELRETEGGTLPPSLQPLANGLGTTGVEAPAYVFTLYNAADRPKIEVEVYEDLDDLVAGLPEIDSDEVKRIAATAVADPGEPVMAFKADFSELVLCFSQVHSGSANPVLVSLDEADLSKKELLEAMQPEGTTAMVQGTCPHCNAQFLTTLEAVINERSDTCPQCGESFIPKPEP